MTDIDVLIVGAGAAGVGAARRLARTSLSFLIVEASPRIGGRAWTETISGMPLDLGCGWLHSADRNVWREVAERSGFAVDRSPSAWREQFRDLGFSRDEQRAAEAAWAAWHDRIEADPPASDRAADALEPDGPWNAYLQALSGYINGASLDTVSIADYRAYDAAATDCNWRLPAGYGTLVAASLPPVPLCLALPVTEIDHSTAPIRITTTRGDPTARAVILTVPTSVLASGAIRFTPAIDDHRHAATRLPLGLADKVFLEIVDGGPFEPETHLLGDPRDPGAISYYIHPFGRPVIEGFLGGPGARRMEALGPAEASTRAIEGLVALFGAGVRRHLRPLLATRWGRMDGINGSYSHALPGEAHLRAMLAAPIDNRLFFAGEATHRTDFSTAHGAYESGWRAAGEAIAALGS